MSYSVNSPGPGPSQDLVARDKKEIKDTDLEPFLDKEYRDSYLDGFVKGSIAVQIHVLREKLALSQVEFAKKLGMTQSAVSRLEDTEYGGVTIKTLLRIAQENNVGLNVEFTDYISVLNKELTFGALTVDDIFESYKKTQVGPPASFVRDRGSD